MLCPGLDSAGELSLEVVPTQHHVCDTFCPLTVFSQVVVIIIIARS